MNLQKVLGVVSLSVTLASCLPDPRVTPIFPTPTPVGSPTPSDPKVEAMRNAAATDPSCKALGNFYWSVGDSTGVKGQGQIGTLWNATNPVTIFSASKWIFSTYVLEKTGGSLTPALIQGLNFTAGYIAGNEKLCVPGDTVGSCFTRELSAFNAAKVGIFVYGSGHMQKIAAQDLGLAPLTRSTLATEVMSVLGTDISLAYEVTELNISAGPILAGAVKLPPTSYEKILTKILNNQYRMKSYLGSNAVPTGIANTQYSLGHWVEADGTFSSVGALGFYPWIDSTKTTWGVIARAERDLSKVVNAPVASQLCGKKMRDAYLSH